MRKRKKLTSLKPSTHYRVNLGSDKAYVDSRGKTWKPERFYEYGLSNQGYNGGRPIRRGDHVEIKSTDDPFLYRTERTGIKSYYFKVKPGTYTVKLHFVETSPSNLMFRISKGIYRDEPAVIINGEEAVPPFCLAKNEEEFGRPVVKTVNSVNADSRNIIEIQWKKPARCNAIEIIKEQ